METDNATTGAAGEHFVMFQLLRRGFIAAPAPARARFIDILVTDDVGVPRWSIQVKARQKGHGWLLGRKHESIIHPQLVYAFVVLKDCPDTYLIPSAEVAKVIREQHRVWLGGTTKAGKPRNDSDTRKLLHCYRPTQYKPFDRKGEAFVASHGEGWLEDYLEAWDTLT